MLKMESEGENNNFDEFLDEEKPGTPNLSPMNQNH